jgi:hypothetical protein
MVKISNFETIYHPTNVDLKNDLVSYYFKATTF